MVSGNVGVIHIIEGVHFNGGHPLLFWEIFLHDLILPPGGIKSEFITLDLHPRITDKIEKINL